jgi:pimeloyl-ACP methyl ester carboxylesterase
VEDISALVKYLRSIGKQKIVLFGHSTGCQVGTHRLMLEAEIGVSADKVNQDCMEYSDYDKHNNTPVDGFIVQAPVSDREAIAVAAPGYEKSINYAAKMISEGRAQDCVPRAYVPDALGAQAISAYRLHSLFAKG